MRQRLGLTALWAAAIIFLFSSAAAALRYATLVAENFTDSSGLDAEFWRWLNVINTAITPLLIAALLTAIIAILVHATLWRRKRVTARP